MKSYSERDGEKGNFNMPTDLAIHQPYYQHP